MRSRLRHQAVARLVMRHDLPLAPDEVGQIGSHQARRPRRHHGEVEARRQLDVPRVHLEDLLAPHQIRTVDHHLTVGAPRPQQGRVKDLGPVGGSQDHDAGLGVEPVELARSWFRVSSRSSWPPQGRTDPARLPQRVQLVPSGSCSRGDGTSRAEAARPPGKERRGAERLSASPPRFVSLRMARCRHHRLRPGRGLRRRCHLAAARTNHLDLGRRQRAGLAFHGDGGRVTEPQVRGRHRLLAFATHALLSATWVALVVRS
jgi:hypothetical protein